LKRWRAYVVREVDAVVVLDSLIMVSMICWSQSSPEVVSPRWLDLEDPSPISSSDTSKVPPEVEHEDGSSDDLSSRRTTRRWAR